MLSLLKVNPLQDIQLDIYPISLTPVLSRVLQSIVGASLWELVSPPNSDDQ